MWNHPLNFSDKCKMAAVQCVSYMGDFTQTNPKKRGLRRAKVSECVCVCSSFDFQVNFTMVMYRPIPIEQSESRAYVWAQSNWPIREQGICIGSIQLANQRAGKCMGLFHLTNQRAGLVCWPIREQVRSADLSERRFDQLSNQREGLVWLTNQNFLFGFHHVVQHKGLEVIYGRSNKHSVITLPLTVSWAVSLIVSWSDSLTFS